MPRPKAPPRVKGPYYEPRRGLYRVRIFEAGGQRDVAFPTEAEAVQAMAELGKLLAQPAERMLGARLDEYIAEKQQRAKAKPETCREQLSCLRRCFSEQLNADMGAISPRTAQALYQRWVEEPVERTGKPREAATHRFYLRLAQGFFGWAVRRGYLILNPFKDVQPVGRVSAGKPQLRIEEARPFAETAFRLFDETGDVLALACVMPLYLGLRASEVLRRRVRDVDCGGSLLWIDAGKTRNARRNLKVDAPELQQRLTKLASGRAPDEPLFGMGSTGQPRRRQSLHSAVRRICKSASVPLVCPHSLRGLWATVSVESGAATSAVAAALGHGSFAVTARHYAQPEAVAGARSARVMELLDRERSGAPSAGVHIDQLSAEQIVARLSPDVLAKIVELVAGLPHRRGAS